MLHASASRWIGNLDVFQTEDPETWEKVYQETMEKKYAKNTRNFNSVIKASPWSGKGKPPIFILPRVRAGPSYKSVPLIADGKSLSSEEVVYCLISKGYPHQDVSSFTLGPIVGEGLCLVNAAFSKCICAKHLEGGGQVDLKRKNFWRRARRPPRSISVIDEHFIRVDGKIYPTVEWLSKNEPLWRPEWEYWRKCVALCSRGDFHWKDDSPIVSYFSPSKEKYLSFVEWKKECYIGPSYQLLEDVPLGTSERISEGKTENNRVMFFLRSAWEHHPLGLVHPMGFKGESEVPVTPEFIRWMYDSPTIMSCQPYVVAGKLLGVPIEK